MYEHTPYWILERLDCVEEVLQQLTVCLFAVCSDVRVTGGRSNPVHHSRASITSPHAPQGQSSFAQFTRHRALAFSDSTLSSFSSCRTKDFLSSLLLEVFACCLGKFRCCGYIIFLFCSVNAFSNVVLCFHNFLLAYLCYLAKFCS